MLTSQISYIFNSNGLSNMLIPPPPHQNPHQNNQKTTPNQTPHKTKPHNTEEGQQESHFSESWPQNHTLAWLPRYQSEHTKIYQFNVSCLVIYGKINPENWDTVLELVQTYPVSTEQYALKASILC